MSSTFDPTRAEYRLTGINCAALNPTAFVVGLGNVAGGHMLKIGAFLPPRTLQIAEGEMGKLAAGRTLHLWTSADDDHSPHELRIAAVDVEARTVTLTKDLPIADRLAGTAAEWIGAVADYAREESAFASGERCFAPGDYANASGSLSLASGLGSHAEGILCEARGDMSFATGNMTVAAALASFAAGTNTRAEGMFATALGAGSIAGGDNSFAAGAGSEARGDSAIAVGFQNRATGHGAVAAGALAHALAAGAVAIGSQVKTSAPGSAIFGTHGEIVDTPENVGLLAIAAGEAKRKHLAVKLLTRKPVANPLAGQEGQAPYLYEMDTGIVVAGHLLPETVAVTGTTLQLDHGLAGRWKVTPSAQVAPTLKNWRDGDRGELVVYNGGNKILFPAAWRWIGTQPTLKSAGVDVFTIYQLDDTIFIKHEVTL